MNQLYRNIIIYILLVFSITGYSQSIEISKDYNSPTPFAYNSADDFYFVSMLGGSCQPISIPSCTRLYNSNNSLFQFTVNDGGNFKLECNFRDSVAGGISFFIQKNGVLKELYCTDFNTDLLLVKYINSNIAGETIVAQVWFHQTEVDYSAHLKITDFAGYGNTKVPDIDITSYTPEQLVNDVLISGCVEALNITYQGDNESIGYFENGVPGLSFTKGIVMSSGRVTNVPGPNDSGSEGSNMHEPGDNDLEAIIGGMDTHDAAVLEFDFIPASNIVSFEYVFGSEEYEEFVGQGFNDVFGFFVSGGPEAYTNVNIARIPVVGVPVSINNVNQTDNSAYYVNNDGGVHLQFDGMTVTLTAELNVTQCQTYHMKLAVADVGDGIYDSGVFLKAGSFNSGASVELRNYNAWGLEGFVHEGCTNDIIFARSDLSNLSDPMSVLISIDGTAINGTDYTTINTNYTIPGGIEFITTDLEALVDGITEGPETVIITVYNGCPCSVQTASDTIVILDQIVFTPTLTNNGPACPGDSVLLSISYLPVPDTCRVEWSNGVIGPSQIWVTPAATTTYTANIYYPCSVKTVSTTVVVNVAPNATASNDGPYCVGDPIHLFSSGGATYRWRGPSSYLSLQQNPTINNSQLINGGTYQVTVTGANGCKSIASTFVDVYPLPVVDLSANTPFCSGDPISFIIDTFPDYFYTGPNSWSSVDSFPIINNVDETNEGWYYVIITDSNMCRDIDSIFIEVNPTPVANAWTNSPICEGGLLQLFSDGGPDYSWTGPDGFTSTDQNPFINPALPINSGDYTVTIRNIYNCSDTFTVSYTVYPTPDASFTNPGPLCINSPNITLSPINSGGTWSGTGIINTVTGVFSPATAGAGTHIVSYSLIQNGCVGSFSNSIVIDAMPVINISPAGPFCVSDAAVNLSATDPGGTWSGTGITDAISGTFDPNLAGTGTHTITYTLTNGTCTDANNISIVVNSVVDATINPSGPFCETDASVNMTAAMPLGTWSGTGITDAATGTFDPTVANPGIHTISYSLTNGGCSDTDTEQVTVYLYPNSDWGIIGPFCETDASVNILPVTVGGTFSGTGITNAAAGTFDPSIAGAGTHIITYTVVNGACTSVTTKSIVVFESVDATISPAGPFCETDPAVILTAADAGGTWSGTGIVNATTGAFDPALAGPGVHTITYNIANGNCNDTHNEPLTVYSNPNADFASAGPFCENDAAVNLVSVNPGGTWTGTGITNAANGTFNPAVAGPGVHSITYTIVNVECTDFVVKTITVNAAVDATITAGGPYCQNQAAINLTAADPGGIWSGTGITNPATGNFNPAIAGPGIHTITYSIANGACSDTDTEIFVVNLFPNTAITPAGPFCQAAAAVNLVAASAGGTWSGTGITSSALGTFNPAVAGSGNHTISYTVINGACTSVSSTVIHVDASVNATITPVPAVCVFNPAFNLTAVSSGGTWSGTGITNSTNGTFDPTIAGAGIHTITYSVTNGTCSDTDTENINVSANPNPTINAAGPFCSTAAALNLTAATAGGTWSGLGITNAALGTFDPSIASSGNHTITYQITLGACSNSDTEVIHVDANVNATITPAGPFCQFDPAVNLTAVSPGGTWGGSGITNTSTGNFSPSIAGIGSHNITYSVVNGLCSDSDNINIIVNVAPDGTITDPGVFCVTDGPVMLTAATAGGTWAGTGIINPGLGTFDPSAANIGTNNITYTISNAFCTTVASIQIFVYNNVVDGTITSTGPYCVSSSELILTAVSAGGTWSGTGVTNPTTGAFNPGIAGPGNHLITYNVGTVACFDSDTQLIHVDDTLSAIITSVGPICETSPAFNLTAATAGGTWSGVGITNSALGTFNPVVAGGGNHFVTYSINNGVCTNTDTFTIQINNDVDATITPAGPFCNNEAIQTLVAVSPGGTWSGTGIVNSVNGLFHPAVAGGGNHIITYSVVNGACSDSDTETIHVDAYPNTTILAAGPFCETSPAVNLSAASAGGTWSGTGITNPLTGTFDPLVAGGGNHTITYEITSGACNSISTQVIHVDDFFAATITAAGPFCNTQPAQNLVAASTGGTWSGTGITDVNVGIFHPGVAGPGDFIIQYSLVNGQCSDNDNISIHVDQYFDATITPAGPFCENSAVINLSAANPSGFWSGNGIIVPAAGTFNPTIAGPGNHVITYTITTGVCSSSDTETIQVDAVLDPSITPAGPFCQNTAAINFSAANIGGTWSGTGITDITNGTFNPAVAGPGNHLVTYQLVNGTCTSSDTETIIVDLYPNTSLPAYGPYCEISAAIDLVEPSIGGTWSGNGIVNPITGLFNPAIAGDGTHLITYTNINGACTSTGTVNIQLDASVDATITSAGPFCSSDGSILLTAVSPNGLWSGTGIVNPVTGLFNPVLAGAGTHIIQYSVSNGICSDTDNISIVVESNPNPTIITTGPFCETDGNQIFSAATLGGVWSGVGIDVTGNFSPSVAGVGSHTITYTLTIGTCVATDQTDITVDQFLDATITSSDNFCIMDSPVHLMAASIGGIWSGNGINATGLFSPAAAGVGNHNITYTNVNGACSDSDSHIFSVNNNPDATITDNLPVCLNTSDFNLVAATAGGTWSGTGISDAVAGTFSPNTAGSGTHTISYSITIGGCSNVDQTDITVNALPAVTISNLLTDYCLNEAAVTVGVSPAGGSLTGDGISGTFFNPATAGVGNHQILYTYSDINSCTNIATVDVSVHDLPTVSINGIDPYYCLYDAAVNPVLLPIGGVFEGSGVVGTSFNPSAAGVGSFELFYHFTDVNSCTDTAFVSTIVLSSPEISFSFIEPSCFGLSDGSITTSISGGLEPYVYLWSDAAGSSTSDLNSINADMYYLTITDDNSCVKIDSVDVTEPLELTAQITNATNPSCFGYNDGSATAVASGGTAEYSFLWDNDGASTTETVNNLADGDYSVTINDLHDCTASATISIVQPTGMVLTFTDLQNVICYSQSNGAASVEVSGGSPSYSAVWNNPASTSGFSISNLSSGYYTVTVTDSQDCEIVDSVEITQPDSLYFVPVINPVICAQQLGSAGITTYGGTAPYEFEWSSGETVPVLFSKIAGTYYVTIEDANNCILQSFIEIGTSGFINAEITQTAYNLCFKDEIANIVAYSDNAADTSLFIWSNFITDSINLNLGADEYFVTITDAWGCKGFDSITVTEPDLLELDISSINIKCKGDLTGRAGVVVVGGTAPYSPIWQNGDHAFSSNTLPAGKIWVTVTDHNGCVDSISTIITEPETELSINLDIEQITCFGAMDASINSYASGGTPPYFFNWNLHGLVLTDPTIRFLDKGNYYLTITDNNNCFADTTIVLFEPGLLGSSYITSNPSCDGNYDGYIMMASYGGTLPYSYFIYDNIATPYLIDSLYEGEYFVMVRDSNNCEHTTGPIALIDNDVDCIHFPVAFSPNGDGYNDEWFIENIHLYPKSVVQIYNRWGQLLYEEKGIDGYWDGTFNGNPVPTGVYIYLLILNNDEKTRTGTLTLVR